MVRISFSFSLFFLYLFSGLQLRAQCPAISCPTNIVANNSPGNCSAIVNYTAPVGTNLCGGSQTQTFNFTGSVQTFTVPNGVTSIDVDVRGAAGGNSTDPTIGSGGLGGKITGTISVTPGQILNINVGGRGADGTINNGGAGGFNGGGTGAMSQGNYSGGGGGGASDIRVPPYGLGNRLVIGGGAGGGAYNYTTSPGFDRGGAGGGATGESGYGGNVSGGQGAGTGGSQITGGVGGYYSGWCTAANGSLGLGGDGAFSCTNTGGGGGGGYYGGGGSCWAGGGGGSSFLPGGIDAQGTQTGNGQVVLSWTGSGPSATALTSGLASGSLFPLGVNTIMYTVTDGLSNTATCSFTVTVADTALPSIICPANISATSTTVSCTAIVTFTAPVGTDNCSGVTTALTAGTTSGSAFPVGTTTETYTATDAAGNTRNCSFLITVSSNISTNQTITVCNGSTVTVGTHIHSATGVFTDTIPSVGGCDSVVTTNLTVSPPIDTQTSVSGSTFTANQAGATYAWIDCENGNTAISGQTAQSFTPVFTGNYAVIITIGNCVDTSACSNLVVGISENSFGSRFSVYPNPSTGKITVDFGRTLHEPSIEICDMTGKTLFSSKQPDSQINSLDIQSISSGIYILKIIEGNQENTMRLIKE